MFKPGPSPPEFSPLPTFPWFPWIIPYLHQKLRIGGHIQRSILGWKHLRNSQMAPWICPPQKKLCLPPLDLGKPLNFCGWSRRLCRYPKYVCLIDIYSDWSSPSQNIHIFSLNRQESNWKFDLIPSIASEGPPAIPNKLMGSCASAEAKGLLRVCTAQSINPKALVHGQRHKESVRNCVYLSSFITSKLHDFTPQKNRMHFFLHPKALPARNSWHQCCSCHVEGLKQGISAASSQQSC